MKILTLVFLGSVNARFSLCICSLIASASMIKSPPSFVDICIRQVMPVNIKISRYCIDIMSEEICK